MAKIRFIIETLGIIIQSIPYGLPAKASANAGSIDVTIHRSIVITLKNEAVFYFIAPASLSFFTE